MSLESRPYIGTWQLNGRELVQHTPDALVYVNGDTALPGCSKCSGKIDMQRFITEVSVDAGTEPGSASATFSLSVPLHHTESFARDAKFLLRPGLEVHIYMRGYFPVMGLYKNLAEPKAKVEFEGSATLPETSTPASSVATPVKAGLDTSGSAKLTHQEWVARFSAEAAEAARLRWPQDPDMQANFIAVALAHSYLETGGNPREGDFNLFGQKGVGTAGSFQSGGSEIFNNERVHSQMTWASFDSASDAFLRYSEHYSQGTAAKFLQSSPAAAIAYQVYVRNYSTGDVPPRVVSIMRTMGFDPQVDPETGYLLKTAKGYTAVLRNPSGQIVGRPRRDYALSRFSQWSRSVTRQVNVDDRADQIRRDGEDAGQLTLSEGSSSGVSGFQKAGKPVTKAQMGPSLLEEMGLAGQGIEDTIAYPYYHVFHGVVTEVSHSYSGGVNSISVNCSSMLHFWHYQNMSTNASVFGARPTNSKLKMSLVGHNFTGMHPYAIMYTLHHDMVGAAGGVAWALSSQSNQTAVSEVGQESLFSLNIKYWERRFSQRAIRLRMHGARGELFSTMAAAWVARTSATSITRLLRERYNDKKRPKTLDITAQSEAVGMSSKARRKAMEGLDKEAAKKLSADQKEANESLLLLNRSQGDGEDNKPVFELNIIEMQAFVSHIGNWGQVNLFESSYESKLDIAEKVMEITGFEFYQDVDGDFVFKPPMWNLDTSKSRVYRIEDIDIINISFSEKEPQVTYMTCKGSQFKNLGGTGLENEWGVRGQYIDYRLVAQFGWRPGTYETAYFNDSKSMFFAAVNRMDVMNIGINSASLTIPVRPELRPGYPVYIPYLDCYYYCNSFAHSHAVGGQCTTTLQLVGKRAKFFAPGKTPGAGERVTIDNITLNNTARPERPLTVIGAGGVPRLSGFPNVVMALDPNEINPLYFVVGSDSENLSDPRVIKHLLKVGEEERLIHRVTTEDSPDGSQFYRFTTHMKVGEGDAAAPITVLFYFKEDDFEGTAAIPKDQKVALAGAEGIPEDRVFSLTKEAVDYERMARLASANQETAAENMAATRAQIATKLAERSELLNLEAKERAAKEAQIQELTSVIDGLTAQLEQDAIRVNNGRKSLESQWHDSNDGKAVGIAFLLDMLDTVGEAYRAREDFQGRGDLTSSINLLDMLSDKKAIFSNGSQPGAYRYYSASHPKREHQAPGIVSYKKGSQTITEEGPPAPIDGTPPTIQMYASDVNPGDPDFANVEAKLIDGQPEVGIRVLNSNKNFPKGQSVSTSDILEMMFTVQPVTIVKSVTSSYESLGEGSLGKDAEAALGTGFSTEGVQQSPGLAGTTRGFFGNQWELWKGQADQAIAAAQAKAQGQFGKSIGQVFAPGFPSTVRVGKTKVSVDTPFADLRVPGVGARATVMTGADLANAVGKALASKFTRGMEGSRQQIKANFIKAGGTEADAKTVLAEFNNLMSGALGATVAGSTKKSRRAQKATLDKTFSPVFPVSDARGYQVVGTYRYGREVSIEPEGVFDQLHKTDLFSLLSKDLIENILRLFVQGKDIEVPQMETVVVNGKTVTRPVKGEVKVRAKGEGAAKYLNEEVLAQLRNRGLTDKQILDYTHLLREGSEQGHIAFSLANIFASGALDGTQKIPVINAAYSLADMNVQQAGHICDCKAAEANVKLQAFGQEEFLQFTPQGAPQLDAVGADPTDAGTRWVALTAAQAAATWRQQQQALRGQVLDRGGSHIVKQFAETFGIDTKAGGNAFTDGLGVQGLDPAVRTSVFKKTIDDADYNFSAEGGPLQQTLSDLDRQAGNVGRKAEEDQ